MNKNTHPIIKGTLMLTITGCITRLIGFYYKIFLSRQIGAVQLGLYQMTFPLFSLCIALSTSGVQLTISRLVGASVQKPQNHLHMQKILQTGLFLSLGISLLTSVVLYAFPSQIAQYMLGNLSCAPALKILACTLPLSAIHICISGYYFGQQKTAVPSAAELFEQLVRVGGVWLLCQIAISKGRPIDLTVAVSGLLIGEIASSLLCVTCLAFGWHKKKNGLHKLPDKELLSVFFRQGTPITCNRFVLSGLQSLEAVLIPGQLQLYGLSASDSYALFGVFTGMALPFILFPSTFVNSFTTMLLPKIAREQATNKEQGLSQTISTSLFGVLILGIFCTGMFLTYGNELGLLFFHSTQAGHYITGLAWLCPLMYISTTMASILHGIGRTSAVFGINLTVMIIRVVLVYTLLPKYGLQGYLWLMLGVQLLSAIWYCIRVYREVPYSFDARLPILVPAIATLAAASMKNITSKLMLTSGLIQLVIDGAVSTLVFGIIIILSMRLPFIRRRC